MGLKFIYTLFVGLLLAAFIGFGIDTFYPSPKEPELPASLQYREAPPGASETPEQIAARKEYDAQYKTYQEQLGIYNRNVSMIALALAVIILVVSLILAGKITILADGLLLGGALTLFYSIIRGTMTAQAGYRFAVISVGLIITLVVGYLKFVRNKTEV